MTLHVVTYRLPGTYPSYQQRRYRRDELARAAYELYETGAAQIWVDGVRVARVKGTPLSGCLICDTGPSAGQSPGYRRIHRAPWVATCICGVESVAPRVYLSRRVATARSRGPLWVALGVVVVTAAMLAFSAFCRGGL